MSDVCLAPQGTKRNQPVIDFCIPPQGLSVGGGAPAFVPTDVAGLEIWIDPSDGTTINFGIDPAVSSITDKSGNGNDLAQATAGSQPTLLTASINGLDTLSSDGIDNIIRNESLTNQPLSQPTTVYMVIAGHEDDTAADYVYDGADTDNRQTMMINANGQVQFYAGSASITHTAITTDGLAVFKVVYDGASSTLYKNGILISTGDPGPDPLVGFVIGGRNLNSFFGEFELCECLVYDSEITGTDDTDVLDYLNAKWTSNVLQVDDVSLPAVQLWMKGDDGITIDTGVSSWIDQSVNAYDAVQASTSLQPTLQAANLNGHDVVRFDGTGTELVILDPTEMTTKTEIHWFAVCRTSNTGSPNVNQGLFASSASEAVNSDFAALLNATGRMQARFQTSGVAANSTDITSMIADTWYIISGSFISGIGSSVKKDNTNSDSYHSDETLLTGHTGNFVIGDIWFTGHHWIGDIAELAIFTTKLSATQEQGVYNGLKAKYAL